MNRNCVPAGRAAATDAGARILVAGYHGKASVCVAFTAAG